MARSFRSALTGRLREAQAVATEAALTGAPVDEVGEARAERRSRLPRRQLIIGAAAVAGMAATPWRARAVDAPRIVIVGAGLAGLSPAPTSSGRQGAWPRPSTSGRTPWAGG